MTDHHEHDPVAGPIVHVYDDIKEADNRLPRWWLLTFYGTIIFACLYWFYYESYRFGLEPLEAYQQEAAATAASSGRPLSNQELEAMASNTSFTTPGARVFAQNCVVCHGDHGEGKIGPNLTDEFWLHGGEPSQIWTTIRDGVAARGMPQWGATLGAIPVQQVAAHVLTLRNTNVQGKGPEGERYTPGAAAAAPAAGNAPDTAAAPAAAAPPAAAAAPDTAAQPAAAAAPSTPSTPPSP